ncbi:major facilitator superfamily domain-containing protein [Mucor lusitanicus]
MESQSVDKSPRLSLNQRLLNSPLMACIAGAAILWVSFGIRQTVGVFLIPITTDTGWDRSTFSIAAALLQLLWGFSQPFLVYLAERKIGFGKGIFVACVFYAVGCFILYASNRSSGLFIFALGVVIGVSCGGNSFPVVLASIGRRFPQNSKYQSIAFGIVSSFGSFGQCCFLPIARAMLTSIGWQMSFVVMGIIMVALSPLAYFLQTVPPKPAELATTTAVSTAAKNNTLDEEKNPTEIIEHDAEEAENRPIEDISAPDIQTALKEAFTNPTFIFITLGFSVCGFHIAFLATHFPAHLQDNGIDPSLAAWTISILGLCSMIGTIFTGYLASIVSPRLVLMGIYGLRAVFLIIVVFIPISVTTVIVFSIFFGFLWLSTVPPTTRFVNQVFGQKYLGTLTSITFVGHQIGSFMGAYVAGILYDKYHRYDRMWYGSIAVAVFAVVANFMAGVEPMNERRLRKSNAAILNSK